MKHKFTFAIVNLNLKFKEYFVTLTTVSCFYKILNIHCPSGFRSYKHHQLSGVLLPGHGWVDGLEVEAERPSRAPLVHVADVASGGVWVSRSRASSQTQANILQKPIIWHPQLLVRLGTQSLEKRRGWGQVTLRL